MQEPQINILSVLILISAGQCLFFSIVLFVCMRRGNWRANFFLAVFCLILSVMFVDGFMNVTSYYGRYPHLIGMVWPVYFLVGPFHYFYVRELCLPKQIVLSWHQLPHFLPAIIYVVLFIFFFSAREIKNVENVPILIYSIPPLAGIPRSILNVLPLLDILQKVLYFMLSYQLIRDYTSSIKQSFSSFEKINLSWLRAILIAYAFLVGLLMSLAYFAVPLGINRQSSYYIYYLSMAAVNYLLFIKGFYQPEILSWLQVAHQVNLVRTDAVMVPAAPVPGMLQGTNETISRGKYNKSLLTNARVADIARQLLELMESRKPYLEPDLTISELADKLSVSSHNLSQVFSRKMSKSFFDFVNEYRVQEARRLLRSPHYTHLSILGIALDAGFNSKNAFYSAFRKCMGMTPSAFMKQRELAAQSASPDDPETA
jgi:AraC-like DNA-binding protein